MCATKMLAAAALALAATQLDSIHAQSVLTAPEDCIEPTLRAQDTSDVAILCGGMVREKAPLSNVTTLEVGIKSATLVMKALVSDTLVSLYVHSGNATQRSYDGAKKVVEFDAGFSELRALTSLKFANVHFKTPNVSFTTPDSLLALTMDGTNADDLTLTVYPGISPKLQQLDLTSNAFAALPKCLYARQYGSTNSLKANVEVLGKTFEVLDAAAYRTLSANVASTPASSLSFELSTKCNFNTGVVESSGKRIAEGIYKVCDGASMIGTPPSRNATGGGTSATLAPGTSAPVATASNSSSNTTMIVLVVFIGVVALALASYLVYKHVLAKKESEMRASDDGRSDNTANLISKADTTTSGKAVLLSSDETLRELRLEHPVQLIKPAGAGRMWIGEYCRERVIVKRIEAEVSDPATTKSLMNQACFLAPLSHPNLVQLKGVTWVAGTDFAVVAEFMDKDNLKTVLSDPDVELDMEAKLGLCLEVARALVYLHSPERNMYVRALSSRKVLVKGANECKVNVFDCYPCVKKAPSIESYGSGELVWLAPEIVTRSFPVDPKRANMYAFGVLMCEILTRVSPFQSLIDELGNTLSDMEIAKRVHRKEVLAPHENHPEYMWAPQSLRDTIDQCLSPTPSVRPTAEEIIIALQDAKVEEIAASLRTGGDFFV